MDFKQYHSPFTWRYGSTDMRHIFSEEHKYTLWRKIWVALARAQYDAGLLTKKELTDLEKHEHTIDIAKILTNEKETRHDVVAAIKEFAEKTTIGGGKIHLGATSMDVVDNADAIRVKEALSLIEKKLLNLIKSFGNQIDRYADHVCMGFTHLQPAEPTTVGYRLSFYAQDALVDLSYLQYVTKTIKAKGMKGAVGTQASYVALLPKAGDAIALEENVMQQLELTAADIATQVAPRKYDYLILSTLTSIAATCAKFAGDVRILQSPPIGEWAEPFAKKQVGSSAMPFKRNPVIAENICSLARYVATLPAVALENATLSYLERTLDDSANKRIIMPEAFLALDEILTKTEILISGLVINENAISRNVAIYAPFAATEAVLMAAVKKGANRQEMHELLRTLSLQAWETIQNGHTNPLETLLKANEMVKRYLSEQELTACMDVNHHIGTASHRAKKIVKKIKSL